MGFFGWFRGIQRAENPQLKHWREAWQRAAAASDADACAALGRQLDELGQPEEEIEIEREMLEGLEAVCALVTAFETSGLPVLATGHRVVGTDLCHFSASVSMPDDPNQPSGRLILTNRRAIFVGGAKAVTVPWHTVGETVQAARDVVLIRTDRQSLSRFRCNSFADALSAAYLARHLAPSRSRRP